VALLAGVGIGSGVNGDAGELTSAKSANTSLRGQVSSLNSQVNTLKGQVASAQAQARNALATDTSKAAAAYAFEVNGPCTWVKIG
jgi:hypothetical protein